MDKVIELSMSKLFDEISQQHYCEYKKSLSLFMELQAQWSAQLDKFKHSLESMMECPDKANEIQSVFRKHNILGSNKTPIELIFENTEEFIYAAQALMSLVPNVSENGIVDSFQEQFILLYKHAVIAITFQAFACESSINEVERPRNTEKRVPTTLRMRRYLESHCSNKDDYLQLELKLKALFNLRNRIAHQKVIKIDFQSFLMHGETILENKHMFLPKELMLVHESIGNLMNTYSQLSEIIIKTN